MLLLVRSVACRMYDSDMSNGGFCFVIYFDKKNLPLFPSNTIHNHSLTMCFLVMQSSSWLLLQAALQRCCYEKVAENMQHIYSRTPMPKCDFNKIAKHECSPVNLLHIFGTHFPMNTSGGLLLYYAAQNWS